MDNVTRLADRYNRRLEQIANSCKSSHLKDIQHISKYQEFLNDWEHEFVLRLLGYARISPKQRDKLDVILRKIKARADLLGKYRYRRYRKDL